MKADIFMGVVFYQRLRHMVSDKSQVRSTGPVTAITRQPVKGRKKHGGIRLGEMERDALLSHGVAFCLQDRLMNCSDSHIAFVCKKCGGLLSVYAQPLKNQAGQVSLRFEQSGKESLLIYLPIFAQLLKSRFPNSDATDLSELQKQ
jgi:DNA-directed RNA polymerase beta subunit